MMIWGDECAWSGEQCLTRARLKRNVHEMQEAVYAKGLTPRALEMAERRYHQALTALMAHNCESVGASENAIARESVSSATSGPADIADLEKLIDRACELYARKGMADIAEEYRDARLVLRTRILMLHANQPAQLFGRLLQETER